MGKKEKSAISPTRDENYPEWYQQVIKEADLAEHSCVRGCMIIKPWGYALWENIQNILDSMIKQTGHQNVYFPLFIPLSFFQKEANHVEGFAKECAVVTHCRLGKDKKGELIPQEELEEPLVVRPTSEMVIGEAFSRWIESYRDLPLLINQWANIVRWEMRTRFFLRTTEFLWQEGHTVHATEKEAVLETKKMLDIYSDFCYQYLAVPVIKGEKTEAERFPGAVNTYCVECMMQDRKALQAGTSHFLGQIFAKASNIKFRTIDQQIEYAWTTSWGVATRLIGALVMTHSDDNGLVLPPRIAPKHIVILPVVHSEESKASVLEYCEKIKNSLQAVSYEASQIKVLLDDRDIRGGEKKWQWIKKGIPIILEVGPRDIKNDNVCIYRRDNLTDMKILKREEFIQNASKILEDLQNSLLKKANDFRYLHTKKINTKEDFYKFFNQENKEIYGGFALCHFCLDLEIEEKIKNDLGVSVRCIPLDEPKKEGKCIFTNKPSQQRVIFAKAY